MPDTQGFRVGTKTRVSVGHGSALSTMATCNTFKDTGNTRCPNYLAFLKCGPPSMGPVYHFAALNLIQLKSKAIKNLLRKSWDNMAAKFLLIPLCLLSPAAVLNSEFHPVSAVFLLRPYWSGDGWSYFSFQGMKVHVVLALNSVLGGSRLPAPLHPPCLINMESTFFDEFISVSQTGGM